MKVNKEYIIRRCYTNKLNATINKSLLNELNVSDMYRFFCLSLERDDYYNVRITLKHLARITGEKETALKNFNNHIRDKVVEMKRYYEPSNSPVFDLIKRNLYQIPHIDIMRLDDMTRFITVSNKLQRINLDVKVKGYYLKLLLIMENDSRTLEIKEIISKLDISRKTVNAYNIDLYNANLIKLFSNRVELIPDNILLDNKSAVQKKQAYRDVSKWIPNITLSKEK